MYETLAMGQVHRTMTVTDLNLLEPPQGPDPERAAPAAWVGIDFSNAGLFGGEASPLGQHSLADSSTGNKDWIPNSQAALNTVLAHWRPLTDFASQVAHILNEAPSNSSWNRVGLLSINDQDEFWSAFGSTTTITDGPASDGGM